MNEYKKDFKSISDEWLAIKRLSVKQSSYVKYKTIIKVHLIPYFKDMEFNHCDEFIIAKFFLTLTDSKKLSSSTIHSIKNVLKSIYQYGEQKYQFNHIDFSIVKIPTSKNKSRTLTKNEEVLLSNYCFANINSTTIAILLSLYTGLRLGEICALQWNDIDYTQEIIKITKTAQRLENDEKDNLKTKIKLLTPKTISSHRYVIIPQFLNDILKTYFSGLKRINVKENYYIVTNSSKVIDPRTLQRRFSKICSTLGFSTNFHSLRHTYATNCIKFGIDVKTVSEMLGHSNVSTTLNRYVHPSFEFKKEQIKKIQLP